MKQTDVEWLELQLLFLVIVSRKGFVREVSNHTVILGITSVDTGASHKNIIDDGEDALASNPLPIISPDSGIMKHSSFVELDAAVMNMLSERDFIRVEVLEA